MEEISLRIRGEVFKVNKELLCKYSDYFRAMFSGYYVESEKKEININMLDPKITSVFIKYMQTGIIPFNEYPLSTVGEMALTANFLQITEIIEHIQEYLDSQLSVNNWLEIMVAARNASYTNLEQYSAAYGLYSFSSMKTEYISTIHNLVWYLSHPYLDSHNELYVFNYGFKWLCKNHKLDDALIIIACLDMKRVTNKNMMAIREILSDYESRLSESLVLEVVDCLLYLTSHNIEISDAMLLSLKIELCEKFSEKAWSELSKIVRDSRTRLLKYIPVMACRKINIENTVQMPHCLFTFEEEKGFEQYLDVADTNLCGWSFTGWGLTKILVVCGEYGRGSGIFMTDIKIYDTLKKKWTLLSVQLPPRSHAGVTTVGDLLYIVGGIDEFGVMLDTAIVYDLKKRSYRSIANLPDRIESVAVCTHNNKVYVAGRYSIYCHETYGDKDFWEMVAGTDSGRIKFLRSHNNYIYCIQSLNRKLYRFRPHIDKELQRIMGFTNAPITVAICNTGKRLLVFNAWQFGKAMVLEYKGESPHESPRTITVNVNDIIIDTNVESSSLVMSLPPLCTDLPLYHRRYLKRHRTRK